MKFSPNPKIVLAVVVAIALVVAFVVVNNAVLSWG